MTMPMPDDDPLADLKVDVQEMLTANANLAAQQIAGLMRRNAELEALVAALRRALIAARAEQAGHEVAQKPARPKVVGGD